jgi:signal transduction histidine kinase
MMEQAIANLLTNALNYTPAGGKVCICTSIEVREDEPWVSISVRDTGPGISGEDLPHLFERFYRGRAGRESDAPGTGLGLAIVKQVVERHHGRIEVENGAEEGGAIFTIWLPHAAEQEAIDK